MIQESDPVIHKKDEGAKIQLKAQKLNRKFPRSTEKIQTFKYKRH